MSLFDNIQIYDENPNMLIPYYLMHSYLYYVEDNPIVSDERT